MNLLCIILKLMVEDTRCVHKYETLVTESFPLTLRLPKRRWWFQSYRLTANYLRHALTFSYFLFYPPSSFLFTLIFLNYSVDSARLNYWAKEAELFAHSNSILAILLYIPLLFIMWILYVSTVNETRLYYFFYFYILIYNPCSF